MISLPGGAGPSMAQIVSEVGSALLSDDPPPTEATSPTPGTAPKARRRDAQSARITSVTLNQFATPGTARVMFTRTYMRRPGVVCTVVESADNGAPVIVVSQYLKNTGTAQAPVYAEWTDADQDVNPIVGCDVRGYRINAKTPAVPALTVLNLGNFLFGTLNSIFATLVGALSNQNTTAPIAVGTQFTCTAVASSQAPVS